MSRGRWRTARLALGTAVALGFARFAYGLTLPAMAGQLRWDLARAGAMTTANGLGYLAGALATVGLAARFGMATTFRLGMVLCAAALGATALTTQYPMLLAARALAGFAGALVFVAGAMLAPTAAFFAGSGLGIAVSGAVIPAVLAQHPQRWPLVWLGLGVAAGLAAAASWTATGPAGTADADADADAAKVRRLWPVAVVYLLFAAGYIAYITFLSAYLVDQRASTAQTTLAWTLLGLAATAGPVLLRRPLARWPAGRTLAVLLGAIGGAAAMVWIHPSTPVVIVSALAYGATFMAVPAVVTAIVRGATPADRLAGRLSVFTVIFAAGQTAGPWLAGTLADHTTAGATLGWTAALCGAGALVALAGGQAGTATGTAAGPRVRIH